MTQLSADARLAREVAHFDDHYAREAAEGIAPLSDFDRLRYTAPSLTTPYPREFFYSLIQPLVGKDTLEIACGNGIDASICAHNGANVHAYDASHASIAMTRRRAAVNGVEHRVHLQHCASLDAAFPGQEFDAILGYAALHHLPLEGLAEQVHARLRPGGVAVFAEPVVNSRAMAILRKLVPLAIDDTTEDERPMNRKAIAEFARPFSRIVSRDFHLVSRVWRLWPNNWPLAVALHNIDNALLKFPPLRRFASLTVFAVYKD